MKRIKILTSTIILSMSLLMTTSVFAQNTNENSINNGDIQTVSVSNKIEVKDCWGKIDISDTDKINNILDIAFQSTQDEEFVNIAKLLLNDLKSELQSIQYNISKESTIIQFIGNKNSYLQDAGIIAISHANNSKTNMLGFSDMNNFSTGLISTAFTDGIKLFNNSTQNAIKDDINVIKSDIISTGLQNLSQMKQSALSKEDKVFKVKFKNTSYGDYGYIIKTVNGKVNWYIVISGEE